MEDINSTSQTDAEQPHNSVSHSRPFFYVQPPSQPFFMYQWPMDPFGQYGFPAPAFPFARPFMAPYQYMQYPGYVVPHAPMQPTDYRRIAPLFPSVASYDLRFRQHFQQMSVHRETMSSEAQTEPGDRVGKLVDNLDGPQACEKAGAVKEANVMLSSTPATMSCTHDAGNCEDAKRELQPAPENAKAEQGEVKPATLSDSMFDTESSQGHLEECALSGVLPLDGSSINEVQSQREDGQLEKEITCFQSENSDHDHASSVLKTQDSGAFVSDLTLRSDACNDRAMDPDKQMGSLSPESVEVIEPLMQATIGELPYQILHLPCNKTSLGLELQEEVNPLVYQDAGSLLPARRYSFGYYPQVAQERQSVLSPSLDELSSRDEIFSTDVEDELMSGQIYVGGGKLTETTDTPTRCSRDLGEDDTCLVCAKTCACCGASLPDDDDDPVLTKRFNYLEKDGACGLSDQDCEFELEDEVRSPSETQKAALRQNASRPLISTCGWTAKQKARKVHEEVELSEQDQGNVRGDCGEQLNAAAKADRVKGRGQKSGQSRSPYSEHQWREGELLEQASWSGCSGKQKQRSCRPANGFQEKGRPGRRRSSCKMFAQQRPKRNEYDDNDEAEFTYCQRGKGLSGASQWGMLPSWNWLITGALILALRCGISLF